MAGRNGSWKRTRLSTKISQSQLSQIVYGKKSGPASERYLKMILEYLGIKEGKNKIA